MLGKVYAYFFCTSNQRAFMYIPVQAVQSYTRHIQNHMTTRESHNVLDTHKATEKERERESVGVLINASHSRRGGLAVGVMSAAFWIHFNSLCWLRYISKPQKYSMQQRDSPTSRHARLMPPPPPHEKDAHSPCRLSRSWTSFAVVSWQWWSSWDPGWTTPQYRENSHY